MAAISRAKYVGFEEAQVKAAEQNTDAAATSYISELEAMYKAAEDTEERTKLWQTFMAQMDDLWKKFMQRHVLLAYTPKDTPALSTNLPDNAVKLASKLDDGPAGHSWAFVSNKQIAAARRPIPTAMDRDVQHNADDAVLHVVSAPNSLYRIDGGVQHRSAQFAAPPTKLSDLLGKSPAISEAELARRQIQKATVSVKVHTTQAGARKRKMMDDYDDDPYGGSAKPWQMDIADRSNKEHMRELRTTVRAIAAGLCAETMSNKVPSHVMVTGAGAGADGIVCLTRVAHKLEWTGPAPPAVGHGAAAPPPIPVLKWTGENWMYTDDTSTSYTCRVARHVWEPHTAPPIQGALFADAAGNEVFVAPEPSRTLWYHNGTQWRVLSRQLLDDDDTVWQGVGEETVTVHWPQPVAVSSDTHFVPLTYRKTLTDNAVVCPTNAHPTHGYMWGQAASSRMNGNLADERETHARFGRNALTSAFPFQETTLTAGDSAWCNDVWNAFKRLMGGTDDLERTYLAPDGNKCYHLVQSAQDKHDVKSPVIQMSNPVDQWCIGQTATPAGDALMATILYISAHVMDTNTY